MSTAAVMIKSNDESPNHRLWLLAIVSTCYMYYLMITFVPFSEPFYRIILKLCVCPSSDCKTIISKLTILKFYLDRFSETFLRTTFQILKFMGNNKLKTKFMSHVLHQPWFCSKQTSRGHSANKSASDWYDLKWLSVTRQIFHISCIFC